MRQAGREVCVCLCVSLRVCLCVCVPVPEIGLMAAVSFYLMEGGGRAEGSAGEKDGER